MKISNVGGRRTATLVRLATTAGLTDLRLQYTSRIMGWPLQVPGWNPHEDGTQALWLASKLKLVLTCCSTDEEGFDYSRAYSPEYKIGVMVRHDWENAPAPALRLAIAECAADIYLRQLEELDGGASIPDLTFEE